MYVHMVCVTCVVCVHVCEYAHVLNAGLLCTGNKFLQDYKPWESIKTDKELCGSYLAACLGLVALLAALVEPYMPSVNRRVHLITSVTIATLMLATLMLVSSC